MTMIIGIVSFGRNKGKTTLIEQITKRMTSQRLTVATIKHAHSSFDTPQKDTWRHLQAGASFTVATTPREIVVIKPSDNPTLQEALDSIPTKPVLLLVEGYKHSTIPKVVCVDNSSDLHKALNEVSNIIAITGSITANTELITIMRSQHPKIEAYGFEELITLLQQNILEDISNNLPGLNCGDCGYEGCRDLAEAIINSEASTEKCIALTGNTTVLTVDNRVIPMKKFPQAFIRGIILGLITSLKNVQHHPQHIEIHIMSQENQ
ncbi:MAG: molybdopterin-guanine dinucleotide biosynthesis protein B [Candidatus Bathyarchaeota archaeon]|nr:MAG: molybdopterin-guanine dinucleotide biosynthesis protein B [Candidatus Bathyarchaeota archaeon]